MTPLDIVIGGDILIMVLVMLICWLIYLKIDNAGIVDVGWALGLALIAVYDSAFSRGFPLRRHIVAAMVGFWGVRLAMHLLGDRIIGKPEDGRYAALKAEWKTDLRLKFFFFFQTQALLNVVLSVPFLLLCWDSFHHIRPNEWAGVGLWAISLVGESMADVQLYRFKADPSNKGKTCRSGLWGYSRHPNYFFEWLMWVAYFVMAVRAPHGMLAIISPLIMLYLLVKVTGVSMTEAHALKTRGDDYRDYQRTTSSFIPWFKKK